MEEHIEEREFDIEQIVRIVVNSAYAVARVLQPGFVEECYKNALLVELVNCGLRARKEEAINVYYKGVTVGTYRADILVEDRLVVELKAVSALAAGHESQLVNYLVATGIDDGLLINFGHSPIEVKRKYRIYKKQ